MIGQADNLGCFGHPPQCLARQERGQGERGWIPKRPKIKGMSQARQVDAVAQ